MLILILEVQSSLVRGTLVWIAQDGSPEILCLAERPVPYQPGMTTGHFVQTTVKALGESVEAVLTRYAAIRHEQKPRKFPRHIERVDYVLSSPWIVCQARVLSLDLGRPTRITRDKVKGLLEAERAKLAPSADGPTQAVEEKIFEVRLNGYPIQAWQNKETKNLEISYTLGVAGSGTLTHFEQACERAVSKKHVHFHSSLLLQYVGLRASMPNRDSCTLIHIHGELSDVVLIDHGNCVFFGSYPTGIRSIIRAVADATKTDEEAADSFLNLYTEKHIEPGNAALVAPAMKKISLDWIRQFRELLESGRTSPGASPDTMIVARAHQEFFAEAFREAYPRARVEIQEIDDGFYARAIHSLEDSRPPKI